MKRFVDAGPPDSQLWLLPPNIEDFVPQDSPVRQLRAILIELDVQALRDKYEGGGRPAYDPVAMIQIIIYGLMSGVRSSRKLAEAAVYDLRYKFLAEMAEPDFRTIARFRTSNEEQIRELFVETVRLGDRTGLIELKHVSVDGTKLEARASKRRYRTDAEIDKLIENADKVAQAMLDDWKRTDDNDEADDNIKPKPPKAKKAENASKRLKAAKEELAKTGKKRVVVTDHECRIMKSSAGLRPGYNAQVTVDSNCQMIVAAEVTQAEGDEAQFEPMIEATNTNVGRLPEISTADAGYWSVDTIKYVEAKKLNAYIAPKGTPDPSLRELKYDEKADEYIDSDGHIYTFERIHQKRQDTRYRIYRCAATEQAKWIRVDFPGYTEMQLKTSTPEGAEIYKRRKAIVEPVFAHIKEGYGLRRLHLNGLAGARIEHLLACITHNLSKIMVSRQMAAGIS